MNIGKFRSFSRDRRPGGFTRRGKKKKIYQGNTCEKEKEGKKN